MGLKVTPEMIAATMKTWPKEKLDKYDREIRILPPHERNAFWHRRAELGKVVGYGKKPDGFWGSLPDPHSGGMVPLEGGERDFARPGVEPVHLGYEAKPGPTSIADRLSFLPGGNDLGKFGDKVIDTPDKVAGAAKAVVKHPAALTDRLFGGAYQPANWPAMLAGKALSKIIGTPEQEKRDIEQGVEHGIHTAQSSFGIRRNVPNLPPPPDIQRIAKKPMSEWTPAEKARVDKYEKMQENFGATGDVIGTGGQAFIPVLRGGGVLKNAIVQQAGTMLAKNVVTPARSWEDAKADLMVGAIGVALPYGVSLLGTFKGLGIFGKKEDQAAVRQVLGHQKSNPQAVAEKVGNLPPVEVAKEVVEGAPLPRIPVGEIRETGLVGELTDDLSTKTQKTLVPHMEEEAGQKPFTANAKPIEPPAPKQPPVPGPEPTAPTVQASGPNVPSRHAEYQLEGDPFSKAVQEAREAILSDESGPAWHKQVTHDDMAKNADKYLRRLLSDKSLPDAIDHQMVNVAKNADGAISDADFVANAALIRYTDNVIKDLPIASPERLALEDKLNKFMNDQVHNRSASGRSLNVTKMIHKMNPEYQFDKARTDIKTAMMNNGLPEQQAAYIAQGQVDKVKPLVEKILKTADKVDKGDTPSLTASLNELLAAIEGSDMRPGMATIEKPQFTQIQLDAIAKKMRAMGKAYDENLITKVAKSTGNKSDDIAIKETKRLMAQIESLARKRSMELGTMQTADMAKLAEGGDAFHAVNPELVGAIDYLNQTVADLKATMQPQELFAGAKKVKAKQAAKVKPTQTQEGAIAKLTDSVNKLGYAIEKTNDMRLSPEIAPENVLNQTRYTNKVVTDLLKDLESGVFKKRISTHPHADSIGGQLSYLRERLRKYKSDFEKDEWARQVINGERPIATPVIGEQGTATRSVQDILDNAEISLARETGTGKPVPITINGEIIVLNSDQARAYAAGMLEDAVPVTTGKKLASGLRLLRLANVASRTKDTISTVANIPFNFAEQTAAAGADYVLSGWKLANRTRLAPSPSAFLSGVKLAPKKTAMTWKTGISGRPFHSEGTQTYLQHAFGKGIGKGDKAAGKLSKVVNASMNLGDNAGFYGMAADELSNELRLLGIKANKMDEVRKIVNANGGYGELASMSQEQLQKTFKGVIDIPEGAITRANERGFVGVYEDPNTVSQLLKQLKGTLNADPENKFKQKEFSWGNVLADFAQVPGSIMKRSMQYSTANAFHIVKTGYNLAKHRAATNVERKAAQRAFANELGRGAVGASLLAAGAAGKRAGVINIPSSSDKQNQINKAAGYEPNSINIAGYSVPLKWLGPPGVAALVGARIQDRIDSGKDVLGNPEEIQDTVTNAIADSVETSGQGGLVSSALRGSKKLVENITQNLLTLPVPGQIQAGIRGATSRQDSIQRGAGVEEESPILKGLKNMVNPIKAVKHVDSPAIKKIKEYSDRMTEMGLPPEVATAIIPSPITTDPDHKGQIGRMDGQVWRGADVTDAELLDLDDEVAKRTMDKYKTMFSNKEFKMHENPRDAKYFANTAAKDIEYYKKQVIREFVEKKQAAKP